MPYKKEFELSIRSDLGFKAPENMTLRLFWALVSEGQLPNWREQIGDWTMLPILTRDGAGLEGEKVVALKDAQKCVAVSLVDSDPLIAKNLQGILRGCGIDMVQPDVVSDERIQALLRP